MKKNYFMLALASMMMAACANNDLVDDLVKEEVPQAIGFETFAQKVTRAENSEETYSLDLKDHHTSFKVWGYKNVQEEYVFNGKEVSYDEAWDYTGHVYWDKAATSYEFYAAAPATESLWTLNKNVEATQSDDYFTISSNYTVTAHNNASLTYEKSFASTQNAVDLMIADKKNVPTTEFGSAVQLNFTHILSRLNITVSKDATMADQTVTLKSLTLCNVNNVGTFNENETLTPGTTLAGGTHERWTLKDSDNDQVLDFTTYSGMTNKELKYIYTGTETTPNGATKTAEYMLQSLIMPQTAGFETVKLDGTSTNLQEPYFTIVYTVTDNDNSEDFSATYNLANAFGVTTGNTLAFNEGWQNTLNITLKPGAISFSAKVATWDDETENLPIN